MKTYLIKYKLFTGKYPIKQGTIRVKNKTNEMEAKVKLEKFFRKNHNFDNMVIEDCKEESFTSSPYDNIFDNIFNKFRTTK